MTAAHILEPFERKKLKRIQKIRSLKCSYFRHIKAKSGASVWQDVESKKAVHTHTKIYIVPL